MALLTLGSDLTSSAANSSMSVFLTPYWLPIPPPELRARERAATGEPLICPAALGELASIAEPAVIPGGVGAPSAGGVGPPPPPGPGAAMAPRAAGLAEKNRC